ncbi:cache domain-containing protein [Paenibacillus sp. CC-CFT747]|nr:cache domain-containing protein [Paenibacillus sp. CC-CFT747]
MTDTAKTLSFQIYRDPSIAKLIYYPKPDIYDVTLAMQQLDNYRMSMPFIESVYVYNSNAGVFYISSDTLRNGTQTREELDDQGILNVLDHQEGVLPYQPIPRTYTLGDSKRVSSYTYLSFDALEKQLSAAVVINIAEDWMNRDFSGSGETSAQTFILNKEGQLLSRNGEDPIRTDYSGLPYISEILDNGSSAAYFVGDVDGVRSLVSYTSADALGWRYVRVTPYGEITREISSMRVKTIAICLGLLLLGGVASVLASRRMNGPIDQVLRRLKTLETERRNDLFIIREEFIRNFLLGRETGSPAILQEKLSACGSKLQVQEYSRLVMLKLDRFPECTERYREEIKLVKFAVLNISTEIVSPLVRVEGADVAEDHVLLVFSHEEKSRLEDASLTDPLKAAQAEIIRHLGVSVSVTSGPVRRPFPKRSPFTSR